MYTLRHSFIHEYFKTSTHKKKKKNLHHKMINVFQTYFENVNLNPISVFSENRLGFYIKDPYYQTVHKKGNRYLVMID